LETERLEEEIRQMERELVVNGQMVREDQGDKLARVMRLDARNMLMSG
jgi:hypothetical protein